MRANPYAVSDGLFELRRMLDDYQHEPMMLDPAYARAFAACLKELGAKALKLEHEISRRDWNDRARKDREVELAVVIEATRPGTNLHLLSPFSRPFSGGRQPSGPGGAA